MMYELSSFLFVVLGIYMMYSTGHLIYTLFKVTKKEYDELQKKSVIDSLAYSMLLILSLHLIQLIIGSIQGNYYPVITPVIKNFKINHLNWDKGFLSINSFFFDCAIINIGYVISKYKNGLINKKKAFKNLLIFLAIIIFCMLIIIFNY